MKFAVVNGITVHYTLNGLSKSVPLAFINPLGSDLRIWDGLIPKFANRFAIIRYDKRGHGLSDCPPGPYTIQDHAIDLARLLDHLQVEAVILIGISVGGLIALDFATIYPQRVKAMVLSDTAARIGTADFWNARITAVRDHGLADVADTILARWFAQTFSEQNPAEYRGYYNMLTRTPLEGYIATCEAIRDSDLSEHARRISAKTLVLCGEDDLATPPDQVQQLAKTLKDARFEKIVKAGHLPCVEQPDKMGKKINQFLDENGFV
jgi:3-oxoadipate enol-lactonase